MTGYIWADKTTISFNLSNKDGMFISIYTNANFVKSPSLDDAFSHPGEYWVLDVTDTNNLTLYSANRISQKPKIGSFSLEACERINNGYRFSFCDARDNKLYRKDILRFYIEPSLSFMLKCLFEASKFPDWETYNDLLRIGELTKEVSNLKEKLLQREIGSKNVDHMITNALYARPEFIGINIERVKSESVVCIAFKDDNKWKAKSLGGISGDFRDTYLFDNVISQGQNLDAKTAHAMFQNATRLGLEYSNK